jgi:hypothetical protein
MSTSTRIAIGVVAVFGVLVAALLGPRLPMRAGGPNRVCNGSFEEGGFVKEGVLAGQDVMHVPNGSRAMFCDSDRNRGWLALRPTFPVTPPTEAVAWFQFQGPPPAGVQGRRIVDLTGFYDRAPLGAISQEFATVPGDPYEVVLVVINDPSFPPPSVTVNFTGNPPVSHTAPRPVSQIGGATFRSVFRATATTTSLQISGNDQNASVPVDAVVVRVFCLFGLDRFCA